MVESTYGNRLHEHTDPLIKLEQSLNKALKRGGIVIVPVFAVGRAQEMIYYLHQLKQAGKIPDVPMYLNSPMAVDAMSTDCRWMSVMGCLKMCGW